eukprot:6275864-Pyramimonas_sp.AAC.1
MHGHGEIAGRPARVHRQQRPLYSARCHGVEGTCGTASFVPTTCSAWPTGSWDSAQHLVGGHSSYDQ